jgi:MFS transporter, DHA2 family, multidrug resistance protein
MTSSPTMSAQGPASEQRVDPPSPQSPWSAAIAIVPILLSVYQTLVLTDVTSDVIRKGIEGDRYIMIWTNVCWGVATLFGVFAGLWAMPRFGSRITLQIGLAWFALGNLLCGAAVDIPTLSVAKLVEGIGKGLVIILCRSTLYRQFDRMVIVAIGFYGIAAYATRPTTPLVTALINDALSWRWIFWINVPIGLLAIPLVRRFIKPDRPPKPLLLQIDWLAVSLLSGWAVSLVFSFGWYRKWGGAASNEFATTAVLALVLPVLLVMRVATGLTFNEHLRRIFRVRSYVLAMCVRMLLLVQLLVVLTLMAQYLTELRDYPREVAGWILAPVTATMAISTFLTTYFHRRSLRHFWLLVGVLGSAGCLWWMASVDNFTSKERIALIMGCWGLFVGLLPPSFLQDEVEGLDRRDALYAGALAVVCLIVPLIVIPTMTSTAVSAWTDRAFDAERLNVRENRPEVQEALGRTADYYRQRGVEGPQQLQMSSTVLGGFVKTEATAEGIQRGLQLLCLGIGGIGLVVTGLLVWPGPRPK